MRTHTHIHTLRSALCERKIVFGDVYQVKWRGNFTSGVKHSLCDLLWCSGLLSCAAGVNLEPFLMIRGSDRVPYLTLSCVGVECELTVLRDPDAVIKSLFTPQYTGITGSLIPGKLDLFALAVF